MTIWMPLLVFVGGLLLTVVVLAIASRASDVLGGPRHLAQGPPEEDHAWRRQTHESR
jgi:hypothetical protein